MSYGNPVNAIDYVLRGIHLLCQPGLRKFVVIPLLINLLIFILISGFLFRKYGGLIQGATAANEWWAALAWLLWLLAGLILLLVYGYTFNLLTSLIAAPFYGVLAEKIAERAGAQASAPEPLWNLILRTLQRELLKLWYFLSRGVLIGAALIILFFIPLAGGLLSLLIGALWAAWCMAVQYTDYVADNHRIGFKQLRHNCLSDL